MTHLADILDLNMIPSLQLRSALITQIDCVTNRDGGYKYILLTNSLGRMLG
jgi:hypothetical protein